MHDGIAREKWIRAEALKAAGAPPELGTEERELWAARVHRLAHYIQTGEHDALAGALWRCPNSPKCWFWSGGER